MYVQPMELLRAKVNQFRSIREMTIPFDESCIILLGINETGKSNILRALALLSRATTVTPDDLRQVRHDEPEPTRASVQFVFRPSESVVRSVVEAFANRTRGIAATLRLKDGDEILDIDAFMRRFAETLPYTVSVPTGTRALQHWAIDTHLELVGNWLSPTDGCPPNHQIQLEGVGGVPLHSVPFIEAEKRMDGIPDSFLRPTKAADVEKLFITTILQVAEAHLPECIAWSFAKDSALPASVSLDEFMRDPSSTPTLKNMFELANCGDVARAVQVARTRANGMRTLLDRVSAVASKELRSLWTDQAVSIALSENGPKIDCAIQDTHGVYDFARRSDGFRRFASFMLMVSARARAGKLDGAILLYDEPDTSLHPAAARQLRKELLRLSERCKIVFSTHSTFMVDAENVGRHYLVTKSNEETHIERAKPGNIRDEEVLYQAIGTTIFAELREMNILLEGYRDRRLLEVALEAPGAEKYAKALSVVGRCHTRGVKGVSPVTAMLDLIHRSYFILTDSDPVALQYQAKHQGPGTWMTYAELVGDSSILTAEDFISIDRVVVAVTAVIPDFPELAGAADVTLDENAPVLRQLEQVLNQARTEKARRSDALNAVKEGIFDGITHAHLRPSTMKLLERLTATLGLTQPDDE